MWSILSRTILRFSYLYILLYLIFWFWNVLSYLVTNALVMSWFWFEFWMSVLEIWFVSIKPEMAVLFVLKTWKLKKKEFRWYEVFITNLIDSINKTSFKTQFTVGINLPKAIFTIVPTLSPKLCWLWTGKIISVSAPKFWSGRRYQWWWNWILFYQKVGWTITNWTISIFSTSITWEVAETMITMHATTNAVTSSSWTYFMRFFIKRKKS